jgi:serine/threonine protein kinase
MDENQFMRGAIPCPLCGTNTETAALGGLCPACLLKQGAAEDTFPDGGKGFEPPAMEELAAKFPGLELLEFIGRGGMGAVYKARQRQLDRLVALKVLPAVMGNDPAFAERFAREARALARLNHANIVTIHDFGQTDGLFYLLMEYVDGMTLRQLLTAGRVAPREALAIVPQICDALQFAHDHGIVHRDIKPENVLMDRRGRVKVADFGIAKLMAGEPELAQAGKAAGFETEAGKVIGTPSYMAPEQAEHPDAVDHRADIFALGVVFYQMLTGELPACRASRRRGRCGSTSGWMRWCCGRSSGIRRCDTRGRAPSRRRSRPLPRTGNRRSRRSIWGSSTNRSANGLACRCCT